MLGKLSEEKPRKMENQQLVSPSRQCSCTPVSFGQGFLNKEELDNTGASLTLSWPGCSCFFLFPRLKSALKGRRFCDVTDIITNATEELKRISQNVFQECFRHLYSPWKKCILATGENFFLMYFKWFSHSCVYRRSVLDTGCTVHTNQ